MMDEHEALIDRRKRKDLIRLLKHHNNVMKNNLDTNLHLLALILEEKDWAEIGMFNQQAWLSPTVTAIAQQAKYLEYYQKEVTNER